MNIGALLQFATVAISTALSAIGVGLGTALISRGTFSGLYAQPAAQQEINKTALIAMALTETGGIITLVIVLMMLVTTAGTDISLYAGIGRMGILFAVGLTSFAVGIVSSWPAQDACKAIARQPFVCNSITNMMLITMSILQTPIIFGFIVAFIINMQAGSVTTLTQSMALLAAGVSLGIGSIGPIIGQGMFAQEACRSIGINRESYRKILTFSLISQAIIESPIIFALLVSLLLLTIPAADAPLKAVAFMSAALCAGVTNIGVGIGSGNTATSACKQIALSPDRYAIFTRTSLLAQGLIDTFAIYGLLIALVLLFFT